MSEPIFFSFKPNLFSGRFFFWFGPLDVELMRKWYCDHYQLRDPNDRIGSLSSKSFTKDGNFDRESTGSCIGGVCSMPDEGHPLIYMACAPNTPVTIGNLVHEIHHAVQRWTQWLGIFTGNESEEVFAYTEGALTEAVLDKIWNNLITLGIDSDSFEMAKKSTEAPEEPLT